MNTSSHRTINGAIMSTACFAVPTLETSPRARHRDTDMSPREPSYTSMCHRKIDGMQSTQPGSCFSAPGDGREQMLADLLAILIILADRGQAHELASGS